VTAVVDASVVVAYLLGDGDDRERAVFLGEVHAPALLDIEVTQALRALVRRSNVDLDRADAARRDLADLTVRRYATSHLLDRAWDLRDVCTTYDALYAALAEALGAPLVTRDLRLARGLAASRSVRCEVVATGR
jgi:predicted nucleic acid-binding protein